MIDERREEQACLYALAILPAEETFEFEEELRRNAELRRLVDELRLSSDALAMAAPVHRPAADLKQRVMQRIDERESSSASASMPRRGSSGLPFWFPWALAASLAAACVILWGQGSYLQQQSTDLHAQVENLRRRADDLRGESSSFAQQMALLQQEVVRLRDKDELAQAKIAVLSSLLADSPKAVAVSVWESDRQKGVLVVQNLAPLPAGKDYQLWMVDPAYKDPVDAGVFSVDDKGTVRFEYSPKSKVSAADKFAVSLERKGGVKKAEGPIVLLSN